MRNFIKKAAVVMVTLGMSACSVYHQDTADVQRGIDSNNRLKVETTDNLIFELRELRRDENGQLVGITGRHSETAKLMLHRPHVKEGNYVKIPFKDEEIKSVYLKNKKMSNIVKIGVPIIGLAGLVGLTNRNFRPDVGY